MWRPKDFGVVMLSAGWLLVAATDGASQSKATGLTITPVSDAALTAPMLYSVGRVKTVAGRVLTLEVDGRLADFIVDDNTSVVARGGSRTVKHGGGPTVGDLVRDGDLVRVAHRELDGVSRASEIHVRGRKATTSR